ncbi:MAG: sensor histidine kinase [Actinomycetota bacterium]|nr:sensor histidine kinase [Actinomycetota bacterium]
MTPLTLNKPLQLLRICLHLLLAGLLVLAVARAFADGASRAPAVLGAAALMGLVYAAGSLLPSVRSSRTAAAYWLAALGAAWLVLLVLTPDGVWIAFPLFFLQLHLVPGKWGLAAVVATTVVAIVGFIWHLGSFALGAIIGPVLGAAVAIAVVRGYQALYRESEQRRRLIEQLRETRNDLAVAERGAGVLAERERLAREIHDTLAQGLSSIQLLLRAAERALPDQPETAARHVVLARETAQDNLTEARRVVRALTPMNLDGASLPAALDRLTVTTRERDGLSVNFHLVGEPREVPKPYEVGLLRIAQSALANAVQHAGASRAELTLTYMDLGIALDVVDDGAGFDPAMVPLRPGGADGGFGLTAMRSRIRSLGGIWSLTSEPGQGTTVAASFPLGQELSETLAPSQASRR